MSCKFNYKGKDYTEAELIKVLSSDPAIMEKYFPQEERYTDDYTPEDLAMFNRKVEKLQKSLDVVVIMDPTIETSRVLGRGDKRVKDAGKPVILVNPNKLFKTTAIHEFGHVFIDSFPGGINNPRLQRALNLLEGTELEREIKALYPELNEEMFAKELITTAIGRKGSDIWDSSEDVSTWQAIKNWFINFIKRTFGVQENEIVRLTKELLDGKNNIEVTIESLPTTDQELRERKIDKEKKEEAKTIKSLEKIYEETLARVTNIYNEYLPKTPEERTRESLNQEEGTTRFESISSLKEQLDKLDKTDRKLGLSKYIAWVKDEIALVNKITDSRKRDNTLTEKKVMASIEWNEGFSMIDDIQKLVIGLNDDGELSDADKKYYDRKLGDIQKKRSQLETKLLHAARKQYAMFMAKNDNKIYTEYARRFRREYKDAELEGSGVTMEEYVREKMLENNYIIEDEAYREALLRAERSVSDIHKLAATMWSEKNATSQDIQVLSTLVDSVESQIQSFASTQATEFDVDNKAFKKDVSNAKNQKEKYKGMFTTSESGQSYFASQYKPEFMEKRKEMMETAFDDVKAQEKYGDIKVSEGKLEYTIDGETRKVRFGDAIKYRVVTGADGSSVHVSYELLGERVYISTAEAIARAEYEHWIEKNTEPVIIKGRDAYSPTQEWVNDDYNKLTIDQKKHLDFLKTRIKEADKMTSGRDSLITRTFNQEFIRLPGMLKSDIQRVVEGDIVGALKHQLSEITSIQKDDFETESSTGRTTKDAIKVFAGISNREKLRVPIPFRKRLEAAEQSFDLHTMVLMNSVAAKNYEKKKEIESTFLIVLEIMKDRKVPDKHGVRGLRKIHALSEKDNDVELFKDPRNGLPNDAKRALDTLENRIYGIKSKDAGTISVGKGKEADLNQLTKSWLKYSGTVALVGNWMNSVINLNMGTINNLIEAAGGEHFNLSDWAKAGVTYWKDIKQISGDWGSNVDKSRTNMFMNIFNVMGDKEYLDNAFEENTRAQALFKTNSLRPIAKAGEHMMQAKVMYATMHHIKVMDANGKYLDKDGNVVSSKKKAASINQMIEFVPTADGGLEMKLNDKVEATTFTLTGGRNQILLETKNLIKYKVRELHGNYDADIQAAAQREFWGKLTFFLRKWVEEGYFRRWRGTATIWKKHEDMTDADRFYSQDAKDNREGYYVTATRFVRRVLMPGLIQMNLDIIKKGAGNLSTHEKANLKKIMMEIFMIGITVLAYASMDDDDDDEVVRRYLLRRSIAELTFFMNPPETIKIISTPTASVGTLKRLMQLFTQVFDPYETYQQGVHKGRSKLTVKALKAFPITSQTERDVKSSLDFLNTVSF